MPELLFYENVAAIGRERHGKHRVKPLGDHGFAATAHAVPLVVAEYVEASREYPIVFARTPDGQMLSLALTGTQVGQNHYLDENKRWNARYVPIFVQRYPFVFAQTGPDQLTACIDESYPGFNTEEGEMLFDTDGGPTPFMKAVFDLLTEYQRQVTLTNAFVKKLEASGLLMEAELRAATHDGQHAQIKGVLVVDAKKFRCLPEAQLQEWFASGELGLVYAHLFSLGNIAELVRRMPAPKQQESSAADAKAE